MATTEAHPVPVQSAAATGFKSRVRGIAEKVPVVRRLVTNKEEINWWRGEVGVPTEKRRPVEMDEKHQRNFIDVIYQRFKTMAPQNSEQELDVWAEWLTLEIAGENGIDLSQ